MAAGMTEAGERIKAAISSVLFVTVCGVAATVTAHSASSAADLGDIVLPALLWLDLGYPLGIRENFALTADRLHGGKHNIVVASWVRVGHNMLCSAGGVGMATVAASVLASAASKYQHRPSANTPVSSSAVPNMQPPVRVIA